MSIRGVKIPQQLRPLARQAAAEGWVITRTGGGHLRWKPPEGAPVFTGSTPKRFGHGDMNTRGQLAKAGLRARRPGKRRRSRPAR